MITKDNIKNVVNSLSDKDKKRVLNSDKEYAVLYLHVFNAGSYASIRLTNDYNRYKNVYRTGGATLYTSEVQRLIRALHMRRIAHEQLKNEYNN